MVCGAEEMGNMTGWLSVPGGRLSWGVHHGIRLPVNCEIQQLVQSQKAVSGAHREDSVEHHAGGTPSPVAGILLACTP